MIDRADKIVIKMDQPDQESFPTNIYKNHLLTYSLKCIVLFCWGVSLWVTQHRYVGISCVLRVPQWRNGPSFFSKYLKPTQGRPLPKPTQTATENWMFSL